MTGAVKFLVAEIKALQCLDKIITCYKRDGVPDSLANLINNKKLVQLFKAKTIHEIEQILTPPKPHYYAGKIAIVTNPFHLDEEELALWIIVGMRAPLEGVVLERCTELFRKVYPEEYEQLQHDLK